MPKNRYTTRLAVTNFVELGLKIPQKRAVFNVI